MEMEIVQLLQNAIDVAAIVFCLLKLVIKSVPAGFLF